MLKSTEIFKLVNYCIQYYLHINNPQIYLTDSQLINLINNNDNDNDYYQKIKINIKIIYIDLDTLLSQWLLVLINFNLCRFKRILKTINNDLNIHFSINKILYTDLIKNMLYDYIPNDKDYLPINKINTLIINPQVLNSCLYHLYKL